MSGAKSGAYRHTAPACRFAHAGYLLRWDPSGLGYCIYILYAHIVDNRHGTSNGDERKRAKLIEERALDLASAYLFFGGRPAIHQPTPRDSEERWKTTAKIEGTYFTVVWTWRGETVRVISMRRAHAQEIRKYREAYRR